MFSWNQSVEYKIIGKLRKSGGESILFFYASDALVSIEKNDSETDEYCNDKVGTTSGHRKRSKRIVAFPREWADSFGDEYYESQAKEAIENAECQDKSFVDEQVAFTKDEGNVTSPTEAANEIKGILKDIGVSDE